MLGYLGFDGPVSRWLPFGSFRVRNSTALKFSYHCVAREAIEKMLDYRPHLAARSGLDCSGLAVFMVTEAAPVAADSSSSSVPALSVYAVHLAPTSSKMLLLDFPKYAWLFKAVLLLGYTWVTRFDKHKGRASWQLLSNGNTPLQALPLGSSSSSSNSAASTVGSKPAAPKFTTGSEVPLEAAVYSYNLGQRTVGMRHPVFGRLLLEGLYAAASGQGLSTGYRVDLDGVAALWLLKW